MTLSAGALELIVLFATAITAAAPVLFVVLWLRDLRRRNIW